MKNSKVKFHLLTLAVYILAFFAGFFTFKLTAVYGVLLATLIADVVATLIVWMFGLFIKNSSIYDPYWSIAPPVILVCWIILAGKPLGTTQVLLLIAVMLWGIRLTYNWIKRFKGFEDQDWRYLMLKEKAPKLWLLTNLGGINMMPTIIVFLAMIPMYYVIFDSGQMSVISLIGFVFAVVAMLLQLFSDISMEKYRNSKHTGIIDVGLWKYSRHPNYLGEVLFWWSVFAIQFGYNLVAWPNIIGAVLMNLLFVFISIPMMEKYIANKYPDYEQYKKEVPRLIPLKIKK